MGRRARFELNKYINLNDKDGDHRWSPGRKRWNYLDYLMEQIPGKDNYPANITDELPDGTEQVIDYNTDEPINSGYYTRFYGLTGDDAMGSSKHRRSWNDRYLFAAKTTSTKVSPVEFDFEEEDENGNVVYHKTISRWSYAIPLEIIYQTPLSAWNPHGIEYKEKDNYDYTRSGSCGSNYDGVGTAFDGWAINNAYFTPASFFEGYSSSDAADTAAENVCALDSNGVPQPVFASGHWVTFPEIGNGIGLVRQRYPIFPIHNGGSAAFKEIKAMQAVVLPEDYDDPIQHPDGFFGDSRDTIYGFELYLMGGGHQHICYISGWRVKSKWLIDADTDSWCTDPSCYAEIECEERNSHSHTVRVWRDYDTDGVTWKYHVSDCRFGSISDSDIFIYPERDSCLNVPSECNGWTIADDYGDTICADNHNSIQR